MTSGMAGRSEQPTADASRLDAVGAELAEGNDSIGRPVSADTALRMPCVRAPMLGAGGEVGDQALPSGWLCGDACEAGIGNHDGVGAGRDGSGSPDAGRGVQRDNLWLSAPGS
jgi:hypothetical protein